MIFPCGTGGRLSNGTLASPELLIAALRLQVLGVISRLRKLRVALDLLDGLTVLSEDERATKRVRKDVAAAIMSPTSADIICQKISHAGSILDP